MLKKIPLTSSALVLALAILGNLFTIQNSRIAPIFVCIAFLMYLLFFIRLLQSGDTLSKELERKNSMAFFSCFPMASMFIGASIYTYSEKIGYYIWFFGLIFHGCLMVYFVMKYFSNIKLKNIYPTWFLLFCGIACASVTGYIFDSIVVAQRCFYFSLFVYILLLPIIFYRAFIKTDIKESLIPSIVTACFPPSMLLAGYINSFDKENVYVIIIFLILTSINYIFTLTQIPYIWSNRSIYATSLAFPTSMVAYSFLLTSIDPITKNYIFDLSQIVIAQILIAIICFVIACIKIFQLTKENLSK